MVKKIIFISLIMILAACKPIVKHEVVEKNVPVMYVPMPPKVERPALSIKKLSKTDRRDIGKLTKAVTDDLTIVLKYSDILETIVNKYRDIAATNPDMSGLMPEDKKKLDEIQDFFKNIGKDADNKDK